MELTDVLQQMEEQGESLNDVRKLAPLVVYLAKQQEKANGFLEKLVKKVVMIEQKEIVIERYDFTDIQKLLQKIADKEVKIPVYEYPESQRVVVENSPDNSETLFLLKEVLSELRKEKEPLVIREFETQKEEGKDAVTGLGRGPYRQFRSRQRIRNRKTIETPDGVKTVFTVPHVPRPGTLEVFAGGQHLYPTDDYTIVGQTLTMNTSPNQIIYLNYDI